MNKKYILPVAAASFLMASCADEFNPTYTSVEIPVDLAKIEELADLTPLKENIKRADHPGFKLGAALDASEFNKQLTVYNVGVTNFDEVVAGNAMKYASCVDNKGNMNFSTVSEFVNKADEAGLTVYGHTLVWHAQQQPKYLNGLIADKPMPKPEGGTIDVEVPVYEVDYSKTSYSFWNELSSSKGATISMGDGCVVVNNPAPADQNYFVQYHIGDGITLEQGKEYILALEIKGDGEGTINWGVGPWSGRAEGTFQFNTEWQVLKKKFTAITDAGSHIMFQSGLFAGTYEIKKVQILEVQQQAAGNPMIEVEVDDFVFDYSQMNYSFWNELSSSKGATISMGDGCVVVNNPAPADQNYFVQYHIGDGITLEQGKEYVLTLEVKGDGEGTINWGVGPWSGRAEGTFQFNTEWQVLKKKFTAITDAGSHIMFQSGLFAGTYEIKKVTIAHIEEQAAPSVQDVVDYEVDYSKTSYSFWNELSSSKGATIKMGDGCVVVNNPAPADQNYFVQYHIGDGFALEQGKEYTLSLEIKGDGEGTINWGVGPWSGRAEGTFQFNTEWQVLKKKFTAITDAGSHIMFQSGLFAGTYEIRKVTISHEEEVAPPVQEVEKTFTEKKPTLVVTSQDKVNESWDTQFWIMTDGFNEGDKYEFSADVRADIKAKASTQIHNAPGDYVHYACVGEVSFTPDWDTYTSEGKLEKSGKSIAFNLNDQATGTKYYFRNISFKVNGKEMVKNGDLSGTDNSAFFSKEYPSKDPVHTAILPQISYTKMVASNTIPLTKEEKDSIISIQLDKWIAGMMDACGGKVKAWDLANELICNGEQRVDGRYALQHGEEGDDQNFYWQDYLGDEKVVQFAVASARQHYAESMEEQGGDDGQLKLFINDYNLEADYDENAKLASLIKWIEIWESDGVTKIDGIGSQMHISYYENPDKLERQKTFIRKSFEMMAATKKLVRISELDMGYYDANGKKLGWAEISSADQAKAGYPKEKAMADYYQWIIETYFEVVPKEQQYGITQWCLTDATGEVGQTGGWRPGEPVGIWDLNWNRKYVYRGWVNALQK